MSPTPEPVRITDEERREVFAAGMHTFGCADPSHKHEGARQDTITAAVEAILTAHLVAVSASLCSQCGEEMAAMVKVGTDDGWCVTCLDEAADGRLAAALAALIERCRGNRADDANGGEPLRNFVLISELQEILDAHGMEPESLSEAEREALHAAMAPWAKVMPHNHLGPEFGPSDGIWVRLDRAVEAILATRYAPALKAGRDAQRADHFENLYRAASVGRCGHSGLPLGECKRSICDCFDFEWTKP